MGPGAVLPGVHYPVYHYPVYHYPGTHYPGTHYPGTPPTTRAHRPHGTSPSPHGTKEVHQAPFGFNSLAKHDVRFETVKKVVRKVVRKVVEM